MHAEVTCLHVVLKIADFVDTKKADDDEMEEDADFEDCEEMDHEGDEDGAVIDIDKFKSACSTSLLQWFNAILKRTETTTHLIGLSRHAENGLDEL